MHKLITPKVIDVMPIGEGQFVLNFTKNAPKGPVTYAVKLTPEQIDKIMQDIAWFQARD